MTLNRTPSHCAWLDSDNVPTHEEVTDIEERLEPLIEDGWIVDPSAIDRGELLEVEVELQADPIFRMASVTTTSARTHGGQ